MKLNNNGQSLVLFVIMLPVILLITILVIDIGRVYVVKNELDSISKLVIEYGLDNLADDDIEEKLVEMVKLNNNSIDLIDINIENEKIYLDLNEKVSGIISNIINVSFLDVRVSFVGYIDNDVKRIERVVD